MTRLLRTKDVVDVENVIAVLVVVAIVLDTFTRLGQDSTGIARRFVFEAWVANAVCSRQMNGQSLKGLRNPVSMEGYGRAGNRKKLTLMKPPSGLARRNGGCELTLG